MLDKILNFIANKMQRKDITSQISMKVAETQNFEVVQQGDKITMTGYIRIAGELAPGVYVEMFEVPEALRPKRYAALATYTNVPCSIGLQTDGKAYLRSTGTQKMTKGDTLIFSGSWYIGGGRNLKRILAFLRKKVGRC